MQMTNEVSALGKNIKKFRTIKDFNRRKLSILTGIDTVELYEIESGVINTLSTSNIKKIAKALEVSTSILTGTNKNSDVYKHINRVILHLEHEFEVNTDYLSDNEKRLIINSLESIINKLL